MSLSCGRAQKLRFFFLFSRYEEPSMSFSRSLFFCLSSLVPFTFSRSLASSNIVVKSQRLVTRTQGTWLYTSYIFFILFFFSTFSSFFLVKSLSSSSLAFGIARCWDSSRKTLRARDRVRIIASVTIERKLARFATT